MVSESDRPLYLLLFYNFFETLVDLNDMILVFSKRQSHALRAHLLPSCMSNSKLEIDLNDIPDLNIK
jgi:hypothetical protein